jgi:hypothetical protein
MQVNLRKAFAIETALANAARAVNVTKTLTLSVYTGDIAERVEAATAKLREDTDTGVELYLAAAKIRALIGTANETVGITTLLRELAGIDSLLSFINGAGKGQTVVDLSLLQRKLATQKARYEAATDRFTDENVNTTLGDQALLDDLNARALVLKRRKVAIADELATLNAATKIEVPAEIVALIEKHSLVA